nr:MAG TPA: venom polypeptide-like protein [Caudoviricetes sp.]
MSHISEKCHTKCHTFMYRCVPLCHHQSTRFKSAALIRHYARPLNNCLNFKLLARN